MYWNEVNEWYLLPTIKLKLWGDEYYTRSSWTVTFVWLKLNVVFGRIKLKKNENK